MRRLRELIGARLIAIAIPRSDGTLVVEAADGEQADETPRDRARASRVEERSCARAPPRREGRLVARRSRGRLRRRPTDRRPDRALRPPRCVRDQPIGVIVAHDKSGPDPRFTNADLRLTEPSQAVPPSPSTSHDESPRMRCASCRGAGARAAAARPRAARPDRPGADVGAARAESGRGCPRPGDSPRHRQCAQSGVETLHDVRRLAVELRPKALDDFGLVPAVERLARASSSRPG